VIELGLHGPQASLDFAEAVAVRELRESHYAELFRAAIDLDFVIAAISIDASLQSSPRHEIHKLRKNVFAFVHAPHRLPKVVKNSISN
jgi:hypothetical protein